MVRCTFKILRCSHHKIFKVYLVIFQHYAFLPIIISITSKFKGKIQNDEDLVLICCPLLTKTSLSLSSIILKVKLFGRLKKFELELNFNCANFNFITKFRYFCGIVLTLNSFFHYTERSLSEIFFRTKNKL